ncbi:ADP-ribose diphosphatase [Glaciecola petra]|uniref:ADP-ribose pyrophosphatase n=1 Tax=Glaciecola petra TaxID=3075602 RepID=A0ABU2ZPH7_9ALTE|nr:ADP-ribose diphosphatase [Aestuariibacter sp. P117]MDT0593362.1 ADP-ribose diphosphatase [Aestuariibacter sp. P117]
MAKFTRDDITVHKVEKLYQGFFSLNKYHVSHPLFEGGESNVITREVFERGHAAAVLMYDPKLDELVLIEQFRMPAFETMQSPWLIEVVAGILEPGESAGDLCYREAQEEAGMAITKLTKICAFLPSPGACTESIELFVGEVDATKASGIHGLDYEAEDIKVLRVSLNEASTWLETGRINNSTAIIAVQWLLLNKHKLLEQWGIK